MTSDLAGESRVAVRLRLLQQINAELTHTLDLQVLGPVLLQHSLAALEADAGALLQMSPDEATLTMVSMRGYAPEFAALFQHIPLDADVPIVDAVRRRQVVCAASSAALVQIYPAHAALRREMGYEAVACVPLVAQETVVGGMVFSFNEPYEFTSGDIDYMQLLAQQCAQVMERGRLYAAEQTARRQAEAARERASFLAEAGSVLSSSLDYETTLASVARLAVPRIADWCAVDIVEDGRLERLATAHIDPAKVELARELGERYPFDPDATTGVAEVLRTSRSELIPEITDDLLVAAVEDAELFQILRELGLRSSMVVPLAARGRVLGTITLIAAESGRKFGGDDLALAEDLAVRAALAVDNARLYRESERIGREREAILAQMAEGVAISDPTGCITFMNEVAVRISGIGEIGMPVEWYVGPYEVLTPEGEPYPLDELPVMRALRTCETIEDAVWRVRRPNGVQVIVQGSASPILAQDGTLYGSVCTFRDVTAQWALERQKEEFLAAAAHDLKTPLATVKGLSQMLVRRLGKDGEIDRHRLSDGLRHIDNNATRMAKLVDELLDVTRLQMDRPLALNRAPVRITALVERAAADCRRTTERHTVRVRSSIPTLEGMWDEERLERVLDNVLSNAVKYSPMGGEIVVTLDRDGSQEVSGNGSQDGSGQSSEDEPRDGGVVRIQVTDPGIGIPPDDLPHVFDRFYRGRNVAGSMPGTGIGLGSARQIVEAHGGAMTVESEEGRGTTVNIRIPLRIPPRG